jgi:hypothetical protein
LACHDRCHDNHSGKRKLEIGRSLGSEQLPKAAKKSSCKHESADIESGESQVIGGDRIQVPTAQEEQRRSQETNSEERDANGSAE